MPEQPPRLLRQLLVHVLRDLPVASLRSRTNSCRRRAGCVSPVARIVIVPGLLPSSITARTAAVSSWWRWRPSSPPGFPGRRPAGRSRSCHHLGEHLLGGELVPVGAARVLADGGGKLAALGVPR